MSDKRLMSLLNKTFGELEPIKHVGGRHSNWLCKCSCGNEVTVQSYRLRSGNKTHCGCLKRKKYSSVYTQELIEQCRSRVEALKQLGLPEYIPGRLDPRSSTH